MTTIALAALSVFAVVFAGYLYTYTRHPFRGRTVVLQLTGQETLKGVLRSRRGPWIVLRDVEVLKDGTWHRAAGEFVVNSAGVLSTQTV
ncbi:MAG: hypothetical protein GEU99_16990 [Luteitalea sp.]|nr:hypothetical protein [Luteitalea sp.]